MPRSALSTTLTWREVTNKPKTEEGSYLVALEDGTVHEAVFRARSLTHGGVTVDWTEWTDPEDHYRMHPTHWAAMPKAPEKKENEE